MKDLKKLYNQVSVKTNKLHLNQFQGVLLDKKRNFLVLTQVVNATVALVSGKLIAEFIMPEDFGLYSLQFAAFTFFFSLFVGPSITFIKASYQKLIPQLGYRPFFLTLLVLATFLFLTLFAFYNLYKPGSITDNYFYLIILLIIPFNIMTGIAADQFNVLNRITLFSALSIMKSLTGLCFLIFVLYLIPSSSKDEVLLWEMQLSIGLVGMIFFISKLKMYPSTHHIDYQGYFKKHLKFTLPLMALAFWSWINNFFDRYIIEVFMSLNDVGIYNANYGLGSKFFLMLCPIFLVMLTPFVYQENAIEIKKKKIRIYALTYLLAGIPILTALYFLSSFIGNLLLSKNYSEGFYIIFWIGLAFFIVTATYLYETIFYAQHKTKIILYSNIIAALTNVFLNLIFIPILGLNGAIIAMIFSVITRFTFVYFKFKTV